MPMSAHSGNLYLNATQVFSHIVKHLQCKTRLFGDTRDYSLRYFHSACRKETHFLPLATCCKPEAGAPDRLPPWRFRQDAASSNRLVATRRRRFNTTFPSRGPRTSGPAAW